MSSLPNSMTVIEIDGFGEPDVLKPIQREIPQPASGEVLIKVAAAGVNRPDVMQRTGMYPPPPGASDIPGLEIAGEVVALGKDVSRLSVGENICALVSGGGYAEYCVAPAPQCLPVPKGFDAVRAAALPETFFTVWANVFERGALTKGESFLVHGGTSGIGTTAIQLAKSFGATVYTTAGSDDKCKACEQLGADVAINYRDKDFVAEIQAQTNKQGVNVILDMVGGDYLPRNIKCMAADGRLLQIALQHGPKGELNLASVMLKRLTVTGSTLRARSIEQKAAIGNALLKNVWPLLEDGTVAPQIYKTFPLVQAAQAHTMMESSQHIGKIILIA
ncbi:MAG: NAD(P)H-quinone oxidoreductase [Arenicellales bacterium WSBS_2016_MAG_OTU3]